MIEKIGKTAGDIWEILGAKGEMGLSQVPKTVKEKQDIVYQALGWLAREGKIMYIQKKSGTSVSLSEDERGIYKNSH